MTESLIVSIQNCFRKSADPIIAEKQKCYMRNQFDFLGLTTDARRLQTKEIFMRHPVSSQVECHMVIKDLWALPEREYQYCALDFAYYHRKKLSLESLSLCEDMVRSKSWWDTVDFLAIHLIGDIVLRDTTIACMDTWIEDPDLWISRTALICQIRKKSMTDQERLFRYCLYKAADKDFFIRKAIGWALREYSKSNPEAIRHFLGEHKSSLSGLSVREASKYV